MKLLVILILFSFSLNQYLQIRSKDKVLRTPATTRISPVCDIFKTVDNREKFLAALENGVNHLIQMAPLTLNRHLVGRSLNECTPNSNSKGLVIAFQGTGAFNPYAFHMLSSLINCSAYRDLSRNIKYNTYVNLLKNFLCKKILCKLHKNFPTLRIWNSYVIT